MSSASDGLNDFDRVAFLQKRVGVMGTADNFEIHFASDSTRLELQGIEELLKRHRVVEGSFVAV